MALRGSNTPTNGIPVAGIAIAHGLTGATGEAVTPNEYWVVPTNAASAGFAYRSAPPDATNVYFAQGTAGGSAIVFFAKSHSIIG